MCHVYMKTRNVSYLLYDKAPNMEDFKDLSECLHRGWEIDIQCPESSALGVQEQNEETKKTHNYR